MWHWYFACIFENLNFDGWSEYWGANRCGYDKIYYPFSGSQLQIYTHKEGLIWHPFRRYIYSLTLEKRTHFPLFWMNTSAQSSRQVKSLGPRMSNRYIHVHRWISAVYDCPIHSHRTWSGMVFGAVASANHHAYHLYYLHRLGWSTFRWFPSHGWVHVERTHWSYMSAH